MDSEDEDVPPQLVSPDVPSTSQNVIPTEPTHEENLESLNQLKSTNQFAHLFHRSNNDNRQFQSNDDDDDNHHHHHHISSRPATSMRMSALRRFRGQEHHGRHLGIGGHFENEKREEHLKQNGDENVKSDAASPAQPRAKGLLTLTCATTLGSTPLHCQFNPDASLLACACSDGVIRLIKTTKTVASDPPRVVFTLCDDDIRHPRSLPVTCLRWRPETCDAWNPDVDKPEHHKILVATYAKGLIKYWHTSSNQCLATFDTHGECLTCIEFSPDGRALLATASDRHLTIYDENSFKVVRHLQSAVDPRDKLKLFQVKFHPTNPHLLFTGGWDDAVNMWDVRVPAENSATSGVIGARPAGVLSSPHVCGEAIDIDPIHNHLLAASWRRESNIQIFDLDTMRLIKEIDQYDDYLRRNIPVVQPYCGQYLGMEHIMLAGSHSNMLKIIDKKDFSVAGSLADLPGAAFCMDYARATDVTTQDTRIAVGSADKVFFLEFLRSRT